MPADDTPVDPPPTPRKVSSIDNGSLELREYIAAAIGAALSGIALVLLVLTYRAGGVVENFNADAFGRQKDILLLALGFLGTVMGYYFGRLPAEQHANASRKQADAANDAAQRAKEDKQKAGKLISETIKKIEVEAAVSGGGDTSNEPLRILREAERVLYSV